MKCNYCGNELPQGSDFCPECGMIISLGGSEETTPETPDTAEAPEVPEYTPNVFRTMEIEEEAPVAAAELAADTTTVETAPVVEAIPEYSESEPVEEVPAAPAEEETFAEPEAVAEPEEVYAPPEYKSELSYLDEKAEEPAADTAEAQAQALFGDDFVAEATGDTIKVPVVAPEAEQTAGKEDNSLIEALFDPSAYASQDYEDITAAHNESIKKEKARSKNSNKGYAMVAALVVVLVGIIFAAGYVMDNILPKLQGDTTTDPSVNADVPSSTLPTTVQPASSTTAPSSTSTTAPSSTTTTAPGSTTTTSPSSTSATSTTASTTAATSGTTTTAATSATQSSQSVSEPSSYNLGYVAYFPKNGAVTMRTKPSSSAATVATQPYGYPLYAMASENGYYYVDSPYHDLDGWVLASSLEIYEEETTTNSTTTTTTKPSDTTTTTTKPSSTGTTNGSSSESELVYYDSPYTATISDALNFRQGPGTNYSIKTVVPYGYIVTVYGCSSTDSDWVYVEVTDERYEQYGSAEGWVLSDYLY